MLREEAFINLLWWARLLFLTEWGQFRLPQSSLIVPGLQALLPSS